MIARHCMRTLAGLGALLLVLFAPSAWAAQCGNGGAGFEAWLSSFKREAAAKGISPATLSTALTEVSYDRKVIRLDRSQHSFKLSFEEFYARRVSNALIRRGQSMIQRHRDLFNRIEQRFGVPAAVLVSIWGLETNYGADRGQNMSIIRSLATLAYDCRRSAFFTNELINALRIVQRGDMTPAQMRGGWAGEIGPMQFTAAAYNRFAVDFDGDGRRDLIHSVPDMLASTANFLKSHGWRAGQSWEPGSANFTALQEWNKAQVYQRTIAVMAAKMSGRS